METVEDVKAYIVKTTDEIADVTNTRQKYRNKLRHCTDEKMILEYKSKSAECTSILKKKREKLKIANFILEDTPKVKEVIKIERQTEKEIREMEQTKKKSRDRGGR